MKKAIAFTLAAVGAAALAGSTLAYDGRGSDNLPCDVGGYWVINHYTADVEPFLLVDGVPAQVEKHPNPGVYHLSSGPVNETTVVVYTGPGQLQLSHCIEREVPPSASPSPSPEPSTGPSPTPSSSPSPVPSPSPRPSLSPSPSPAPSTIPTPSLSPTPTLPPTDTEAQQDPVISDIGLLLFAVILLGGSLIAGAIEYADRRKES